MDPAAEAQAWLEPRADEMAALLGELVAIDTENPPGRQLGRCGRALHAAMRRLGLSPELIEIAPLRELEDPCVVRCTVGDGSHDLLPRALRCRPSAGSGSVSPPAEGRQDQRARHGRHEGRPRQHAHGALAARELALLGDRRIVLHFVCDEETGSVAGRDIYARPGSSMPRRSRCSRRSPPAASSGTRAEARSPCAYRPPAVRRTSAMSTRASTPSST